MTLREMVNGVWSDNALIALMGSLHVVRSYRQKEAATHEGGIDELKNWISTYGDCSCQEAISKSINFENINKWLNDLEISDIELDSNFFRFACLPLLEDTKNEELNNF